MPSSIGVNELIPLMPLRSEGGEAFVSEDMHFAKEKSSDKGPPSLNREPSIHTYWEYPQVERVVRPN